MARVGPGACFNMNASIRSTISLLINSWGASSNGTRVVAMPNCFNRCALRCAYENGRASSLVPCAQNKKKRNNSKIKGMING